MSSTEPLKDRCGARLRNKPGRYCAKSRAPGSNRCRLHGGATPRGPALPQFKTGRYSKYLGGALGDAYKASLADPKLLDLKESIAVLDAIAKRAAARASENDTPRFRARLRDLWEEFNSAGKAEAKDRARQQLGELINEGDLEDGALRFLSDSIERYSKRAEEATKLGLAKHAAIPASDLIILFSRLAEAVTRTAPREVAAKVLIEMDQLLAPLHGAGPQTAGERHRADADRARAERGGGRKRDNTPPE